MLRNLITPLALGLFLIGTAQADVVDYHWSFDDAQPGDTQFFERNGGPSGVIPKGSIGGGQNGNGLSLDSYGDYAQIFMNDVPTHDFTISFWANINPTVQQGLFSIANPVSGGHDRHIGVDGAGLGYLRVWNGRYTTLSFDHGLTNDGLWHQWTLSANDNQGLSMYIDDNLVFNTTAINHSDFPSEDRVYLGYSYDLGHAVGAMDELSIRSGTFTPLEMRQANAVPVFFSGVIGLLLVGASRCRRRTIVLK